MADVAVEAMTLALADIDASAQGGSVRVTFVVGDGVQTRSGQTHVPANRPDPAGEAWLTLQLVEPTARYRALAWPGGLTDDGVAHDVLYVDVHELGAPAVARFAHCYERHDGRPCPVGAPTPCGPVQGIVPAGVDTIGVTTVLAPPGVNEFAASGRRAVQMLVEDLGADTAAFDRDPLTFQPALDAFVQGLPVGEMADDDWWWLHSVLAGYVAEVLVTNRNGTWTTLPDPTVPRGERYVVAVTGPDGQVRHVDTFDLVHEELRPVPQRIPRIVERALDAAGG